MLIIVVIGGLTSLPGALLGTVWIGFLRYGNYSGQTQFLASGFGVLVLMWFFPGGLAQIAYGTRDALLRVVARRRGIVVPSLVADQLVVEAEEAAEADAVVGAAATVDEIARAGVIRCPECGEAVALDAALEHEHFTAVPT